MTEKILLLLLFLFIVIVGYGIVNYIANKKWGYTPKREKELEKDSLNLKKSK